MENSLNNSGLISVIVPIYNTEKYLKQCVDSILAQTYSGGIELILVVDGSPDNSLEICKNYEQNFKSLSNSVSSLIIINKQNGGLPSARNAGLDIASGEFVAHIDSDDWVEPDYLERLHSEMVKNNADLAICKTILQNRTNKHYKKPKKEKRITFTNIEAMRHMFSDRHFSGCVHSKLFKRKIIGDLRINENFHYGEDLYFSYHYLKKCEKAVFINSARYHYTRTQGSIVRGKTISPRKLSLLDTADSITTDAENFDLSVALCAKSWKFVATLSLRFEILTRGYKNKKIKARMKNSMKNNVKYLAKNKLAMPYHKIFLVFYYCFFKWF